MDTDSLLVVASALTQTTNDKQQVVPMLEQLQALPEDLGRVKRLLADSGYASEDNINACTQAKIQPLIALGREAHHGGLFERFAEPAPLRGQPTALETMRHRLKTRRGRKLYALRKCTVEPVFGLIKHVMKFRQFLLRGIVAARGEWSLVCLAWNLKRMNTPSAPEARPNSLVVTIPDRVTTLSSALRNVLSSVSSQRSRQMSRRGPIHRKTRTSSPTGCSYGRTTCQEGGVSWFSKSIR